jgi:hypothetical protein
MLRVLVRIFIVWPFRLVRWVWPVVSRWGKEADPNAWRRSEEYRRICATVHAINERIYGQKTCVRCLTIDPPPGHPHPWHVAHDVAAAVDPSKRMDENNLRLKCWVCNLGQGIKKGFPYWDWVNQRVFFIKYPMRWAVLTWQRRVRGWKC